MRLNPPVVFPPLPLVVLCACVMAWPPLGLVATLAFQTPLGLTDLIDLLVAACQASSAWCILLLTIPVC
jgi:hypothetical protein